MTGGQLFVKLFIWTWSLGMLSIENARDILGNDAEEMTDNQVQNLLDFLYCICNVVYNRKGLDKPNFDAK